MMMKRRGHLYQTLQKRLLWFSRNQPQFLPNLVRLEIFPRIKMRNTAHKPPVVVSAHLHSAFFAFFFFFFFFSFFAFFSSSAFSASLRCARSSKNLSSLYPLATPDTLAARPR